MIALPVFTSRAFRQSAIFVRHDSPLVSAQQLAGKKIGVPQWSQTAGVYVRGYLEHSENVPLDSIQWVQAGLNQAGRKDSVASVLPNNMTLTVRPADTLGDLLLRGEIDAIISARPPDALAAVAGGVRRLFSDSRRVEETYFQNTRIFPIMHLIVLRREVYAANRWIAKNLFDAFETSKTRSLGRATNAQASYIPAAWMADEIEKTNALVFEGAKPWPYGLADNVKSIEAFLSYCFEQGVTSRKLEAAELFALETLDIERV
jgi:4,5-dihydroxyphthalate decarboxylase